MKLDDLAKICKVDKATVSRALNNKKGVSDKKRQEILQEAMKHGFTPNAFASALAGGSKYCVMILFPSLDLLNNDYYGKLFLNLVKNLQVEKYSLTTASLENENYVSIINNQKVDGVLLLNSNKYLDIFNLCKKKELPLVGIGTGFENYFDEQNTLPTPVIATSNFQAGEDAANYLSSLGYQKIVYITADGIQSFTDRQLGLEKQCKKREIDLTKIVIDCLSYNSKNYVLETAKKLAKVKIDFSSSAIFCANDDIAMGLMYHLKDHDDFYPCPILGFDNTFGFEYFALNISSFHQDIEKISEDSSATIIEMIQNKEFRLKKFNIKYIKAELIERESTKVFKKMNRIK